MGADQRSLPVLASSTYIFSLSFSFMPISMLLLATSICPSLTMCVEG